MCKRDVSLTLKGLIGVPYRFGEPDGTQKENGAEKVSYDDLSEIFVRSKATISECVNQTESEWKELQHKVAEAEEIEKIAKQQLIEEEKQRLRLQQENNQKKNEKSE